MQADKWEIWCSLDMHLLLVAKLLIDLQVPAAVNTVNTESNAQLQQDRDQEGSKENQTADRQQVLLLMIPCASPQNLAFSTPNSLNHRGLHDFKAFWLGYCFDTWNMLNIGICAEQISLDLSRDGSSMGTVVLNVFKDPPLGSQRFLQLAKRSAGGYRLSRIEGISDVSPLACVDCKLWH